MTISNEIIGLTAGFLTGISMLPQLIKTIKEKKAENISPFMIIILIIGTGLWSYYGFLKEDLPIIISNSFSCLVNCMMLILKIRFTNASVKA